MYLIRTRTKKRMLTSILQEVTHTLNILPTSGTKLTPFHIMHGSEPIPIPRPHTEEPPTQTTPENWRDEASHVFEDLVYSAHARLQKYHDAMKESYDRSRRPTSVLT